MSETKCKITSKQVGKAASVKSKIQAPEAPIDNRSLFEKLQEQKDLKEMQWQEEHAFKNNTFNKALEEDEAQFLDAVDAAR